MLCQKHFSLKRLQLQLHAQQASQPHLYLRQKRSLYSRRSSASCSRSQAARHARSVTA